MFNKSRWAKNCTLTPTVFYNVLGCVYYYDTHKICKRIYFAVVFYPINQAHEKR